MSLRMASFKAAEQQLLSPSLFTGRWLLDRKAVSSVLASSLGESRNSPWEAQGV